MVLNKIPKKIRSKVKIFLSAVNDSFSYLLDEDYKLESIKISKTYVVDNVIDVIYENEKLNRKILIQYQPNDIDGEVVDLLSVMLYKRVGSHYNELDFDIYLKKYRPNLDIEKLSSPLKNDKSSFIENIEISVSGYAYYLKDVGFNLINGNEWEDGLVYDWSSAESMLYDEQSKFLDENSKNKEDSENPDGSDM